MKDSEDRDQTLSSLFAGAGARLPQHAQKGTNSTPTYSSLSKEAIDFIRYKGPNLPSRQATLSEIALSQG